MKDIFRDSTIGQLVRLVTRNKVLQYVEETADFKCPHCYANNSNEEKTSSTGLSDPEKALAGRASDPVSSSNSETQIPIETADDDLERTDTETEDVEGGHRPMGMFKIPTQAELQRTYSQAAAAERAVSRAIEPTKTSDGTILVDWYTTDDPENPQNWSSIKKLFVSLQICLYSFAVYVGSSIYSPTTPFVMEEFGVGSVAASLGLALYVLAYGIGPMIFSPLSEIPALGRNWIYNITFVIFIILCIPTAFINNFAGLLVLRFFTGFFGSPCLATGAATFSDMYSVVKLPYLIAFWAGAVTMGPALAPIIAGFSVGVKGWHWFAWELLWLSGPICLVMLFALPETSAANILLRRARRLRLATGKKHMKSQSEIDQANMTSSAVAFDALIKPWQINMLDPAVAFTTVYTALVYGIFYSFFEAFPLVYTDMYHFNLGESSLPFLSVIVSLAVCMPAYCGYYYFTVEPRVKIQGFGPPEDRLIPGLVATFFVPAGLFLFAWTAQPQIHYFPSIIGVFLTMIGCYTIIQSLFLYLPFTYPQYAASLFAANDFARSSFAAGCILFSGPMFNNLGVPKGVSLLGGLTVGCTGGIYALYWWGDKLRARSRFAVK